MRNHNVNSGPEFRPYHPVMKLQIVHNFGNRICDLTLICYGSTPTAQNAAFINGDNPVVSTKCNVDLKSMLDPGSRCESRILFRVMYYLQFK